MKQWKVGRRVSGNGATFLVDYPDTDAIASRVLFGHGVYTHSEWTKFHLNEIVQRFYVPA